MTNNKNWGGAREGSGAKKISKIYSEKIKKRWLKAANKLSKEFGFSIEESALRLIYDDKVSSSSKASILKVYNDVLVIKETESSSTVEKVQTPKIYLPEKRSDPAKLTVVK